VQKLAEVCIRRPVFAAMLILALVVGTAEGCHKGKGGYFQPTPARTR